MSIRVARAYVALFLVFGAGAYQYSGLAPSFDCFGKKLYVTVANAAGQNCTTTCTNNDVKPCSGWSTCWDKFVSCSAAGKDQDGRNCKGCCFSCKVVCDEPPPPPAQPPTITSSIVCSQTGNNGWCVGGETLQLTASDPQGYTLTISGSIGGTPFTCAAGNTCNKALPDGNGAITYSVVASQSGKTASGSTTWKRDATFPTATIIVPTPTGSNGWFRTVPVSVSVTGSDNLSGIAIARLSLDGGVSWQANSVSLSADGNYVVHYGADDLAGNKHDYSGVNVLIDTVPPTVSYSVSGTLGSNNWYVSQSIVTANATDATSGIGSILISDNGGTGQPSPVTLNGGVHTLTITATDVAGNSKSVPQTVYVDLAGPSITPSLNGTSGLNGWYTSDVDVSASASDILSGVQGSVEVSQDNGTSWSSLPITLSDGVHPLVFRSYDNAGNVSMLNQTVKVDTVAPTFTTSTVGTAGNSGWYLSSADTTASPNDTVSGVDHVEYNQNGTGWINGPSVTSSDGVNAIDIKVYDIAGNVASGSITVKVDTVIPTFTTSIAGTIGNMDWYLSSTTTDISPADGISGVDHVEYNQNEAGWKTGTSFVSNDGVNKVDFVVYDIAGNTAGGSLNIKVDTVAPTYTTSVAGTAGNAGWYLSPTNTTIFPEDVTSGIDHVEYNQNEAGWEIGTSFASRDGVNTVGVKIYDVAGNVKSDSFDVKVDTANPFSRFLLPANGSSDTVVTGLFTLSGLSSDFTSGIGAADITLDGGATWLPLSVSADGSWLYDWNTHGLPNGTYKIWVRATDIAGNQESILLGSGGSDDEATVTLLLNNTPPVIRLTPEWFIWESGNLVIKSDYFPIKSGRIVISDSQDRWPKVVINFDDTYPSVIQWDRRFADRTLAPSGNYQVKVSACNTYDLCAEKKATIKIPFIAVLVPTQLPEVTPVATVEVTTNVVPTIQPQEEVVPIAEVPVVVETQPQPEPKVTYTRSILFFVTLIALMWALSSSALSDRRPKAILAIASTISQKRDANF